MTRGSTAPVRLVSAAAGRTPAGTLGSAFSADVEVVIEDRGQDKAVGVWGHRPLDDRWQLYPGRYVRALAGGRELWHIRVVGPPVDRFAVRYDVLGGVHWDNNGAADYRLDAVAAEREDGLATAVLGVPLRVVRWDLGWSGLVVTLLVQHHDHDKQVGVRYTLVGWSTWLETTGTFLRALPPGGTDTQPAAELWRVHVPMGAGVSGRFAAFPGQAGTTGWDNDFGDDFRF